MITKEKVKKEIDRLSDTELGKVHLCLSSLSKTNKSTPNIRSFKLKGKLDKEDLRALAYCHVNDIMSGKSIL